jgi:hypothetical protein
MRAAELALECARVEELWLAALFTLDQRPANHLNLCTALLLSPYVTSRFLCDYLTVLPEVHRRAVHTRSLLRIFGGSTQCSADTSREMIWLL